MLAQKLCKMTLVDEGCCVYKGLDVGMYSGRAGGDRPRLQTAGRIDKSVCHFIDRNLVATHLSAD